LEFLIAWGILFLRILICLSIFGFGIGLTLMFDCLLNRWFELIGGFIFIGIFSMLITLIVHWVEPGAGIIW
jgi:hypothetical protein